MNHTHRQLYGGERSAAPVCYREDLPSDSAGRSCEFASSAEAMLAPGGFQLAVVVFSYTTPAA